MEQEEGKREAQPTPQSASASSLELEKRVAALRADLKALEDMVKKARKVDQDEVMGMKKWVTGSLHDDRNELLSRIGATRDEVTGLRKEYLQESASSYERIRNLIEEFDGVKEHVAGLKQEVKELHNEVTEIGGNVGANWRILYKFVTDQRVVNDEFRSAFSDLRSQLTELGERIPNPSQP